MVIADILIIYGYFFSNYLCITRLGEIKMCVKWHRKDTVLKPFCLQPVGLISIKIIRCVYCDET